MRKHTELLFVASVCFSVECLLRLVNICAPLSNKVSIRSPSQPQNFPHKASFSRYLPMSQKREVSWSADVICPTATLFSTSTSSDAGRDPVAVTASREAAGGDPCELSARSIWEGTARSGSELGSSEGRPTRRNEFPPTTNCQKWDATTKDLLQSRGK